MMGNVCTATNEIVFVMDYLMEMYNFTIVSFHFLLIKKNILYMYKITIVPFIKMLNSQSAFMASSWPQKNKATNFPKIIDFCQIKKECSIVKYG